MAQHDPRLAELTAMIESIVGQVLNKSLGEQMATWAANNARTSLYLSRETGDRNRVSDADQVFGAMSQIASYITQFNKLKNTSSSFASGLGGLAGVYGAYKSGDPIGGAMSGYQLGKAFGFSPYLGAALGLLAGIFSPGIDKWYRPKFKDAKKAFDKLFTMDRGERDEYYMPDSYYFRTGYGSGGSYGGHRKIVVKVGNNQFGEYIRESLTNDYESQLVRGLVY